MTFEQLFLNLLKLYSNKAEFYVIDNTECERFDGISEPDTIYMENYALLPADGGDKTVQIAPTAELKELQFIDNALSFSVSDISGREHELFLQVRVAPQIDLLEKPKPQLLKFRFANRDLAIIKGEPRSIIVEPDCCHEILDNDEILSEKDLVSGEVQQVLVGAIEGTPVEIKNFVTYFGIKARVYGNYELLRKSLAEIGIADFLPKWGER